MTDSPSDRFLALWNEHSGIPARVAYTWTRTLADRQDLEQEIALQAWYSYPRFDGRAKFSTWLYRIALNVAISGSRRERVRCRHVITTPLDEAVDHRAAAIAEQQELAAPLRAAIETLDDAERALLLLHLDGHDHGEIAAILGISTSNVGTRLHRLRERLRSQLQ